MLEQVKQTSLKRLSYLSGHLEGVRRMLESEAYCVDVLKQTYAIRRAIEKLETVLLEGHLRDCVGTELNKGQEDHLITELIDLYQLANR